MEHEKFLGAADLERPSFISELFSETPTGPFMSPSERKEETPQADLIKHTNWKFKRN